MSTRDIIEAAKQDAHGAFFTEGQIHAFAAEIALMEAVCEAADNVPCPDMQRDYLSGSCTGCDLEALCAANLTLVAYREERQ